MSARTNYIVQPASKSEAHLECGPLNDLDIDDFMRFEEIDSNFKGIGLNDETRNNIYGLIAAILHLGNISYKEKNEGHSDGCEIAESSRNSVLITADLFGVDPIQLEEALLNREIRTNKETLRQVCFVLQLHSDLLILEM